MWRSVIGYEGLYEVSDDGQVRSLGRWVPSKGGSTQFRPGRILKQSRLAPVHYRQVTLCNAGIERSALVHRLVLESFIGAPGEDVQGCHGDGDVGNNTLANLRWGTAQDNADDRALMGTNNLGIRNGRSRLRRQAVA